MKKQGTSNDRPELAMMNEPDPPTNRSAQQRSPRRDATRERLLVAANRRFREQGYEAATAAAIAADVGVTERTFFRHFPTKADVLVANWERHGDALRDVLDAPDVPGPTGTDVSTLVGDALRAFLRGVAEELDAGLDSVVRLYTDRSAFLAIMEHLLDIESQLAEGLSRRTGRSVHDFDVRVTANASMGVVRASIRAAVLQPSGPGMLELLELGLAELRPVFDALSDDATSNTTTSGGEAGD